MQIHIHHYHRIEFDESSEFVKLVRAVHQDQQLLLQGNKLIMAQLDELMGVLNTIATDVSAEVSRLSQLSFQLTQINDTTPSMVDLQPAINLANSIRQNLEGTQAAAASTATPAPDAGTTPAPDAGTTPAPDAGTTPA